MSDLTQRPAASPASAPAPAAPATEVPIDPVGGAPGALGPQAPGKPAEQEERQSSNLSRRESLTRAFERSRQAQAEAARTQQAQADKSRAKPAPTDAARQVPKPELRPPQHREAGRFARDPAAQQQQQQPIAGQPAASQQQDQGQQPGQQQRGEHGQDRAGPVLPEGAPFREAPTRFGEKARQEWHAAPESVRGAVHQMAREFDGAYQRYRGDFEEMETLRPYHQMAQQQGITLRRAFDNYYQMEQKLRTDLVGGLDVIVRNMGMKHPDGSPVTLRDVAHHISQLSPEQHQMTQHSNQQQAASMQIGELQKQIQQLSQGMGQMVYQQRYTQALSKVDQFAEGRPRFEELADLIKVELDHGYTLEQAYRRAELLRPNPHAAQTRTQSAQTRRTSIAGAPDSNGGTRPAEGRREANGKHPTRREALARAMRRVQSA